MKISAIPYAPQVHQHGWFVTAKSTKAQRIKDLAAHAVHAAPCPALCLGAQCKRAQSAAS